MKSLLALSSVFVALITVVASFHPTPLKRLREQQNFEPSSMQRQQLKEVMERCEVMQKGWDTVCEQEPKLEAMRHRVAVGSSSKFHRDCSLREGLVAAEAMKAGTVATLYPVQALALGQSTAARVVPRSKDGWPEGYEQVVQPSLPGLKGLRIDADPKERCPGWLAHLVNDGACPLAPSHKPEGWKDDTDLSKYVKASVESANVALVPFGNAVPLLCLVTLREVAAGEELLAHYGPAYWMDAGARLQQREGVETVDTTRGNDEDEEEKEKCISAVLEELDMKRFYDEIAGLTVAVSMEYTKEADNLATILTYQLAGGELGSKNLAEGNRKQRREGSGKGKMNTKGKKNATKNGKRLGKAAASGFGR